MSMAFEEEQRQIKSAIPNMEQYLETETDKSDSLQRFIDKVKCITQLTELTPEIVHEFIEKIVVSKPEYIDVKRHQNLKYIIMEQALFENHHQNKWKNCSKSICRLLHQYWMNTKQKLSVLAH